jgi:hypothetical protein
VALAEKVLLIAKSIKLIVEDGRSDDDGLLYLEDVEALLEDGHLPSYFTENPAGVAESEQRFTLYRRLAAHARSTAICHAS